MNEQMSPDFEAKVQFFAEQYVTDFGDYLIDSDFCNCIGQSINEHPDLDEQTKDAMRRGLVRAHHNAGV